MTTPFVGRDAPAGSVERWCWAARCVWAPGWRNGPGTPASSGPLRSRAGRARAGTGGRGGSERVGDEAADGTAGGGVGDVAGVRVVRAAPRRPPAQLDDQMGDRLRLRGSERARLGPHDDVALVASEQLLAHGAEDLRELGQVLDRALDHFDGQPHPREHVEQLAADSLDFGALLTHAPTG